MSGFEITCIVLVVLWAALLIWDRSGDGEPVLEHDEEY